MVSNNVGKLNIIIGGMWAGKSSELISRYNRYTLGGKLCLMIKYKGDTRYSNDDKVITHDGIVINSISCNLLSEIENFILNYDVICIDEIQFFKDADIFCDKWANEGKIVEVCGLNGTCFRTPFQVISNLIPFADNIKLCKAVCKKTGDDAIYSDRISDEVGDVVIGGDDKYVALDRKSYLDKHYKGINENHFNKYVELIENNYESVDIKNVVDFNKSIKYSDYVKYSDPK